MEAKHILVIDNDPDDLLLMVTALQQGKSPNIITVINDGAQALAMFNTPGKLPGILPDLILLDIRLSNNVGLDILAAIKTHPGHRSIPVVVISRSGGDEDIQKAYQSFANCYICKPDHRGRFIDVLHLIDEFWLNIVKLPKSISI
jgi:CheY-like chemotaxis protein